MLVVHICSNTVLCTGCRRHALSALPTLSQGHKDYGTLQTAAQQLQAVLSGQGLPGVQLPSEPGLAEWLQQRLASSDSKIEVRLCLRPMVVLRCQVFDPVSLLPGRILSNCAKTLCSTLSPPFAPAPQTASALALHSRL